MSRIKKFGTFINENYSQEPVNEEGLLAKVKNVVTKLFSKLNPSGPKKGKSMVVSFTPDKGSILDQVNNYYKGTEFEETPAKEPKEVEVEETSEANVPLEYPTDDVPNVSADALKVKIKSGYKSLLSGGRGKPIWIFGAPGIGKTQIVAQVCDELGIGMLNVDLQFMEPADFLGIPTVVDMGTEGEHDKIGSGITRPNPPAMLPMENQAGNPMIDKGGIIFFDEANRASDPVLNGFMNVAQQRRMNNMKLHPKWFIVSAGNRPIDSEKVAELDFALADRFTVVNYVPTVEGFTKYILGNKNLKNNLFIPELLGFLNFSKEAFHRLDTSSKLLKFPTPRAWVDAAMVLDDRLKELEEEGRGEIPADEVTSILSGEVGQPAAMEFLRFYKVAKTIKLEDIKHVFEDPKKAPVPPKKNGIMEADVAFAIITAIVFKSKDMKVTPDQFKNVITYSTLLNAAEYATAFMKMFNDMHPYVKKDAEYTKHLKIWADHYKKDIG